MTRLPDLAVLPREPSSGSGEGIVLRGLLHEALIIDDRDDPLVEVVRELDAAGLTARRIAKTLSLSVPLVEYLQGLAGTASLEEARLKHAQAVQDWFTGVVWPTGGEAIVTAQTSWREDARVCEVSIGSPGRRSTERLARLPTAVAKPRAPSPDDIALAFGVRGARLIGDSREVVVRARLALSREGTVVLAPFADHVDRRLTGHFLEQSREDERLARLSHDVSRGVETGLLQRSLGAFSDLTLSLSAREYYTRNDRADVARAARRVIIAVGEHVGALAMERPRPLVDTVAYLAYAGRLADDELALVDRTALSELREANDRAVHATAAALDALTGSAGVDLSERLELARWLFGAFLRAQPAALPGDVPPSELRQRVDALERLLDRIIRTVELLEDQDG